MILYPQLPFASAQQLANERRTLPLDVAMRSTGVDHPDVIFTPTGGARVDKRRLLALREMLLSVAEKHGFPKEAPELSRLTFDRETASVLYQQMELQPAEASKGGVWSFLTCVLACDLVRWRFPGDTDGTAIDRFMAGRRNVFQLIHAVHGPPLVGPTRTRRGRRSTN